jgi:hypothetical protein
MIRIRLKINNTSVKHTTVLKVAVIARRNDEAIQVQATTWIASSFLLAGDGSRLFRQPHVKRNDMVIFRQLLSERMIN